MGILWRAKPRRATLNDVDLEFRKHVIEWHRRADGLGFWFTTSGTFYRGDWRAVFVELDVDAAYCVFDRMLDDNEIIFFFQGEHLKDWAMGTHFKAMVRHLLPGQVLDGRTYDCSMFYAKRGHLFDEHAYRANFDARFGKWRKRASLLES